MAGKGAWITLLVDDIETLDNIQTNYPISRSGLIRIMVENFLKEVEEKGGIPLYPNDKSTNNMTDRIHVNITPETAFSKTVVAIQRRYGINNAQLIFMAIRHGITLYQRGEMILTQGDPDERAESATIDAH